MSNLGVAPRLDYDIVLECPEIGSERRDTMLQEKSVVALSQIIGQLGFDEKRSLLHARRLIDLDLDDQGLELEIGKLSSTVAETRINHLRAVILSGVRQIQSELPERNVPSEKMMMAA